MSAYAALAGRILAQITRKGAVVTFLAADIPAGPPVYDPLTDTYSGGGTGASSENVTARAIQLLSDPARLAALGLVLENPVELGVAGKNLDVTPTPGMSFVWPEDGTTYVIKNAEAIGPDGDPILWIITGSE